MNEKFKVGDKVRKVSGYQFLGEVLSVFYTTKKELRLVVEMEVNGESIGLLHIYNEKQLEAREDEQKGI